MKRKNKGTKDEAHYLAELEAYRTGEGGEGISENTLESPSRKQALAELAEIAELFRQIKPGPGDISEAVDAKILALIRRRAKEIRDQRKVFRLFPNRSWAAVAAAGVFVFVISWSLFVSLRNGTEPSPAKHSARVTSRFSKDIDGNGSVDIVDAYLMARRVKEGQSVPGEWDFNNDGEVNERDVEVVAQTAVVLKSRDT